MELPRRFAPATLRLKELMATRLGKPRLLFCHRRLPSDGDNTRGCKPLQQRSHRELVELIDGAVYIVGRETKLGTRDSPSLYDRSSDLGLPYSQPRFRRPRN